MSKRKPRQLDWRGHVALVVKMVDTEELDSSAGRRAGSSPVRGTLLVSEYSG